MTHPVLAAVDGSPQSIAAARWAACEAARLGLPLRLVHVWPWPRHTPPALPGLSEVRGRTLGMLADTEAEIRRAQPGLGVSVELLDGPVPGGVVAASRTAEIVVMGSRGLGGVTGRVLGSVSLAVSTHAACPVVVVLSDESEASLHDTGEVVVGVDVTSHCAAVIEFAFRAASTRAARVRVVHAWSHRPGTDEVLEEEQRARLVHAAVLDGMQAHPGVEAVEDVQRGDAVWALVGAARGADLLVLGSRTSRHGTPRVGPATHALVHHVQCPIAVVPHA